jgi:hypothetical protein
VRILFWPRFFLALARLPERRHYQAEPSQARPAGLARTNDTDFAEANALAEGGSSEACQTASLPARAWS